MDKYQNIVALFSKALRMNVDTLLPQAKQLGTNQVVLGYFDTLQLYTLEMDSQESPGWIENIWRENLRIAKMLNGEFYYHPLHLTADFIEESKERNETQMLIADGYEAFWKCEKPYVFLSLAQASGVGTPAMLRSIIRDELKNYPNICCACYHTLELSDLALLWKSDNLIDILRLLQNLYKQPSFGDLNTFPTVSYDYVENWQSGMSGDPRILHISTQYAVKAPNEVSNYLATLPKSNQQPRFVAGIDDLQIAADTTESWLLEFLNKSLFDPVGKHAYHTAFYDSSTQVGIAYTWERPILSTLSSEGATDPKNVGGVHPITRQCSDLLACFQEIVPPENHSSWHKAVVSLLNAMTDMSRSWVLDGFCYLTLESAQSFYDWIKCISQDHMWDKVSGNHQMELIQKFVRGWGDLMDQATKTDGRYLQMPGFSPSFSEIPSRLLEFYLAFTKSCIHMSQRSNQDLDNTSLMLVPKICRRVKVHSIFKSMRPVVRAVNIGSASDHYQNHLLYVDIPLSMLYNPKLVMCCLGHEQAHFYTAQRWRNRDERKNMLLGAVAVELSIHLHMDLPDVIKDIFIDLKTALTRAEAQVERTGKDVSADDLAAFRNLEDSDRLMALMQYAVVDAVQKNFEKWRKQCLSIIRVQKNTLISNHEILHWQTLTNICAQNLLHKRNNFTHILSNLVYLFRECYADITMIALIGLTLEEYLNLAEREISAFHDFADTEEPGRYYVAVERWAAVIYTAWPEELRNIFSTASKLSQFQEDIWYFLKMQGGQGEKNTLRAGYHNVDSIAFLEEYLADCWDTINSDLNKQVMDCTTSPRCVFQKIAREHTAESAIFDQVIQEYRQTLVSC